MKWRSDLALLALVTASIGLSAPRSPAAESGSSSSARSWAKVSVTLPSAETAFPAGNGADLAQAHCLICHSADMVLSQPALTLAQWRAEIDKMRNVYGAAVPPDVNDTLAQYLFDITTGAASKAAPNR